MNALSGAYPAGITRFRKKDKTKTHGNEKTEDNGT